MSLLLVLCDGLKLCPPQRKGEILISGTYECDLIWHQSFGSYRQVKMRSFWCLIQHDWYLIRKEAQREDFHGTIETDRGVIVSQTKGFLGLLEAERGKKGSSLRACSLYSKYGASIQIQENVILQECFHIVLKPLSASRSWRKLSGWTSTFP